MPISPVTWDDRGRKQESCMPAGSICGAMSGAFLRNQTSLRVPRASRSPSTARPMGRSNVRTSVDSPLPLARTASSLLAWYVVTKSEAPSCCNTATKPSDCVYRNSMAAGIAGGALGAIVSKVSLGGIATTVDIEVSPSAGDQRSSFRIVPTPRLLVKEELLLL